MFIGADFDDTEEGDDETKEARGLPIERLNPKEIISTLSEAVSAKLGVRKLSVQLEVTVLWVRKEQRVLREKLQMQQELGMSNYGGGHNPKARVMRRKNTWKAFTQLTILEEIRGQVEVIQEISW